MVNGLLTAAFCFFSVALTSASFGIAVAITFLYLLIIISLVQVTFGQARPVILDAELFGLLLILWLILSGSWRDNFWSGTLFVIQDYRYVWGWAIVAMALGTVMSLRTLLVPLIVGYSFQFLGSLLVIASHHQVSSVSTLLGIFPPLNRAYGLGGPLVQAWLAIFFSGFFYFQLKYARTSRILSVLTWVIFLAVFFHVGFFIDSRTGFIGIVLTIILATYFIDNRDRPRIITTGILLFGLASLVTLLNDRVASGFSNALSFLVRGDGFNTSVGQRLQAWTNLQNFSSTQFLFGFGSGNWFSVMEAWFIQGTLGQYVYKWRDFHSQFLWLFVQGGLIAVVIYMVFAFRILALSIKYRSGTLGAAIVGVGCSIFSILIFSGLFNSIFTNIREGHITFLMLICWSVLIRLARAELDSNGKP